MDWTIVQGGLCKRGACSKWANGLSLAAEQSIEVGSRNMDMGFLQVAPLLEKGCSEWASELSLAAQQSIGWSQKAWMGRLYKVDFVGACSEWEWAFPCC